MNIKIAPSSMNAWEFCPKYNFLEGFQQEALMSIWYQYNEDYNWTQRAWEEATDNIPYYDDGYEYGIFCDEHDSDPEHDRCPDNCYYQTERIIGGKRRENRFINPELTYNRMKIKLDRDYETCMKKMMFYYRMIDE